jgi:hypothetical protein
MRRRTLLRLALAGAVGVPLSACGGEARSGGGGRVLVAYFSRPGENWWIGGRRDLEVGNTEVLVRAIRARLDCDVHRIRAADPYPDDYDATVRRNVREQDADARPPIANPWHPSTGTTRRGARSVRDWPCAASGPARPAPRSTHGCARPGCAASAPQP